MKTPEEIKKGMEICFLKPNPKLSCAGCPYGDMRVCGNDLGVDILAYIQQLEAAAPKWISVKDELPPVGERVLACAGGRVVYEAFIGCDDSWFKAQNHSGFVFDITHWMPLPKPLKKEHNADGRQT